MTSRVICYEQTLEFFPSGGNVGNDVCHVSQHRGKEHDTEEQLGHDESVLPLGPRLGQPAHGGQRDRAPIVALEVVENKVCRVAPGPVRVAKV